MYPMSIARTSGENTPCAATAGRSVVYAPYNTDSATRCVSTAMRSPPHGVYGRDATSTNTPLTRPLCSFTAPMQNTVTMPLSAQEFVSMSKNPRLPSALPVHVSPFESPTHSYCMSGVSPTQLADNRGRKSNVHQHTSVGTGCPPSPGVSTDALRQTTLPSAGRAHSASAFFSVGNMGPSSWQTLAPPTAHTAVLSAGSSMMYMAPSSAMHSAMRTPMHSIAAVAEELPEADRSDTNLVVQCVPHHLVEADIRTAFECFGDVTSVAIMRNIHTGKSLRTAFVRFATHEQALRALRAFRRWIVTRVSAATPPLAWIPTAPGSDVMCPVPVHRMDIAPATTVSTTAEPDGAAAAEVLDAVFSTAHVAHLTVTWARRTHDDNTLTAEERARVRKLFIRNVPTSCTKRTLLKIFRKFGRVGHVSIHRDNKSAADKTNQRHIAFVVYDDVGAAETAAAAIHNTTPFPECNGICLMIKMTYDSSDTATDTTTTEGGEARAHPSTKSTSGRARTAAGEKNATVKASGAAHASAADTVAASAALSTANTSAAMHSSVSATPTTTPVGVRRALMNIATTPCADADHNASSTRAGDGLLEGSLRLTRSASKLSSPHLCQVASAHEDILPATNEQAKALTTSSLSGSGTDSSLTGHVTGAADVTAEQISQTASYSLPSDPSRLRSDDFLLTAHHGSALGAPHNPTSAGSPRWASSAGASQGITLTVHRGGRVECILRSDDVAYA